MNLVFEKFAGIRDKGESYKKIFFYWLPELISVAILVTIPPMFDSWVVAQIGSMAMFGAMNMGINLLHTLNKFAEAIPVAAVAIIGRNNGAGNYEQCGQDLGDTFWTTFILGFTQLVLIYVGANAIYHWLGVSDQMASFGTPFLQLKSFGIFFTFITLGLFGFMRAVKNTRVPMILNLVGIGTFMFFDYALVLGKFGFAPHGLMGSATATVIQYCVMLIAALGYILLNPDYKKYFSQMFFAHFKINRAIHLLHLSWPIIIDKITIALSYVWLSKKLAELGDRSINSYGVVVTLERAAFLPAVASAGIITFLVSNFLGAKDIDGATANIKKVYLLTCATLFPAILILSLQAPYFISFFDPNNQFTTFAARVLPPISLLVIFDFTQVVFAGALRGAGDVQFVMWIRVLACSCFFVPVSALLSTITFLGPTAKFTLIYGSFYITTGIIGLAYLKRLLSHKWQKNEA
jgi:MATE family multidrug resistance protein